MVDDVPPEVKKDRLIQINEAQEKIVTKINENLLNETFDVLIEGKKEDKWFGRNRNDKLVFLDDTDVSAGETINVRMRYSCTTRGNRRNHPRRFPY